MGKWDRWHVVCLDCAMVVSLHGGLMAEIGADLHRMKNDHRVEVHHCDADTRFS